MASTAARTEMRVMGSWDSVVAAEGGGSRKSTAATLAATMAIPGYRWRTEGELRAAVVHRARASAPPSRARSEMDSRGGMIGTRGHQVERSRISTPARRDKLSKRDDPLPSVTSWFEDHNARWEETEPPLLPDVFQTQGDIMSFTSVPVIPRGGSRPPSQASTRVPVTYESALMTPVSPLRQQQQHQQQQEFNDWLKSTLDDIAPITAASVQQGPQRSASSAKRSPVAHLANATEPPTFEKCLHVLFSAEERNRAAVVKEALRLQGLLLMDYYTMVNRSRIAAARQADMLHDLLLKERVGRANLEAQWNRERAVEVRAFEARQTTLEQRQRIIRASCRTGGYGDDDKADAQQQVALTLTSADTSAALLHTAPSGRKEKVVLAVSRGFSDVAPKLDLIPAVMRQRMMVSAKKNSDQLRAELAAQVPAAITVQWESLIHGRTETPRQAFLLGKSGRTGSTRSDASSLRPTSRSTPHKTMSPFFGASGLMDRSLVEVMAHRDSAVSFVQQQEAPPTPAVDDSPKQRLVLKAGSLRVRSKAQKSAALQLALNTDNSPIQHAASFSSIVNASATSSPSVVKTPNDLKATPAPTSARRGGARTAPTGERSAIAKGLKSLLVQAHRDRTAPPPPRSEVVDELPSPAVEEHRLSVYGAPTFDAPALEVRDASSGTIQPWFGAIHQRRAPRKASARRTRTPSHSPSRRSTASSPRRSASRAAQQHRDRQAPADEVALWILYAGIEGVCPDTPPAGCLTMHLTLASEDSHLVPPGLTPAETRLALHNAIRTDAPGQRFAASLGDAFGCASSGFHTVETGSTDEYDQGAWCLEEKDRALTLLCPAPSNSDEEMHMSRHKKSFSAYSDFSW